ncbi:DoxX family membrane protein [Lujinxingia sediminis]|uniref:DoxX family membrane protein n=2 Tax=Lujinxingia sediminis TaxID=2480984 RepID=A0ABY0CS96_9DELT|nr:DoxX family membrane protein [Lujinxingia sediminis]
MLSGIFIVAGLNHLIDPSRTAARLETSPMGFLATAIAPAQPLVVLSGIALLIGGLALLLGLYTRAAALGLLALIVPITLTVQVGSMATMGPLFKNIGLAGGLIFFIAHGADTFGFDAWRARTRQPTR